MKLKNIIKCCVFCVLLICIYSGKVQAANPSRVLLEPEMLYTSYDATGDGIPDKIEIVTYGSNYNYVKDGLKIYVNDKNVYQIKQQDFFSVTVELCTLKNGTVYIYLCVGEEESGSIPTCGMFQYKNGKLVKVLDFRTFYKYGSLNYGTIEEVSKNGIKVNLHSMSWIMGPLEMQYTFKYKNGKLCVASNKGKVIRRYSKKLYLTSDYTIKVYKNKTGNKKKFILEKGDKVKITACYVKKSNVRFQIKTKSGKTGWIKSPKKALKEGKGYFRESFYAG